MAHFSYFLLLLLATICIIFPAESTELWNQYCNDNAAIKSTKVSSNIDILLSRLVSETLQLQDGYTVSSAGASKAQVYGLAQCRGDVSRDDCADCIQTAAKEIRNLCPKQSDARVWYDYCFLRYSTQMFIGKADMSVGIIFYNVENVSDPDSFNKKLGSLTDKVTSQAVKPGSKGLGEGKSKLSNSEKIYELVQCTRDLSSFDCTQCLAAAIGNYDGYCKDKKGCRVLYSSCIIRYELYPFYFPLDATETLGHVPLKNYGSGHI